MEQKNLLLTGAVNKDREGKDREGKDREGKDREGRQRQRRQERQTGLFRDIRILQWQAGSYRTKNQLEIRQAGTLDCYGTCQCSALLNSVFVIWNSFPVRVVSFFRINIPLSEPYHG